MGAIIPMPVHFDPAEALLLLSHGGIAALAPGVDAVISDPRTGPHPVRMMGVGLILYERRANWGEYPRLHRKILGIGLALEVPAVAAGLVWAIIFSARHLSSLLSLLASLVLTASTIAFQGLYLCRGDGAFDSDCVGLRATASREPYAKTPQNIRAATLVLVN